MKRILFTVIIAVYTLVVIAIFGSIFLFGHIYHQTKQVQAIKAQLAEDEETIQRLDSIINEYEKYN